MKDFEAPSIAVTHFDLQDIMTTSESDETGGDIFTTPDDEFEDV